MSEKTIVQLIDDTTGELADETVEFELDGDKYYIDLTADNAAKLRGALARYVQAARKLPPRRRSQYTAPASRAQKKTSAIEEKKERDIVRRWANQNGFNVAKRGSIKPDIIDTWKKAGKPMPEPEATDDGQLDDTQQRPATPPIVQFSG